MAPNDVIDSPARTIADLEGVEGVVLAHAAEAMQR